MKYSLNINNVDDNMFYTEYMLKKLIMINKHTIVSNDEADFILVSLCDISEIKILKDIRDKYLNKKIVVGGHLSVFFKLLGLFADYVNVGQAFEFFKCDTEDDIKKLDSIYYRNKDSIIIPSVLIEWNICPIVQMSKKRYTYWSGIGCKNKCSFCLTSWTNKSQMNNIHRIKKSFEVIPKNSVLKLIENEGSNTETELGNYIVEKVKDMLLVDYVKIQNIKTKIIRIGLEFAREETRKRNGKYFTNDQLIYAIKKAREENTILQFFCIGGLDNRKDWFDLFDTIPDYYKFAPKLIFKWTNLEHHMFTPLHKKRFDINLDNYLDGVFRDEIFHGNWHRMKNLKTLPVKYPASALFRTALLHCTNINEYNKIWELRNTKCINEVYREIKESNVLDNDYSDEIKFWYND